MRPGAWLSLLVGMGLLAGCVPAGRYPSIKASSASTTSAPARPPVNPNHGWLEPELTLDPPIVFVTLEKQPQLWQSLKDYWNPPPPPHVGLRTIHLGQHPLAAATALVAAAQLEVVYVKVPLGLPDPASYIPASNPPTWLRWQLGKKLFHDKNLLPRQEAASCASCHKPTEGFSEHRGALAEPLSFHPPTLINSLYNRQQFWDGRVNQLEEVLVRALDDDQPPADTPARAQLPDLRHSWHGIFQRISRSPEYCREFELAFGVSQPTLDLIAKCLATYVRTILSGNSLVDRAWAEARKGGKQEVEPEHFEAILEETALKSLEKPVAARQETARQLARGYALFHGRARCSKCHPAPLYSDGSFHNVGIRESDRVQRPGQEYGRFRVLSVGLKDRTMIGAFRTPSLRALPRTWPYFHDGQTGTLRQVLEHYNSGLAEQFNRYLDPMLLAGPHRAQRLNLSAEEMDALLLFLQALDGEPVPVAITRAP